MAQPIPIENHHFPSSVAALAMRGPVSVPPSELWVPGNKNEGLICLEPGTGQRVHDHSLSERPN